MGTQKSKKIAPLPAGQIGPIPQFSLPIAQPGQPLEIIYGHNTTVKKVLMQFNALVGSLTLEPDDARDVARKLMLYADLAEGKKVN